MKSILALLRSLALSIGIGRPKLGDYHVYPSTSGLPLSGGTLSGPLNMGSNEITNLPAPSSSGDAATKGYVDSHAGASSALSAGNLSTVIPQSPARGLGLIQPNPLPWTPVTGALRSYNTPSALNASGHQDAICTDGDGNVWGTETAPKIFKLAPNGVFTEYTLTTTGGGNSDFRGICSDGVNVWVLDVHDTGVNTELIKCTPGGVSTGYSMGAVLNSSQIGSIARGPDNRTWFGTSNSAYAVDNTGGITVYPVTHGISAICAHTDGNMYATSYSGSFLTKITTAGVVTETAVANLAPNGIASGFGLLWINAFNSGNNEWFLTGVKPDGTIVYQYFVGIFTQLHGISIGGNGKIYVTDYGSTTLNEVDPFTGLVTPISIPGHPSFGQSTCIGGDGNVYAMINGTNQVSMVPLTLSMGSITLGTPLPVISGGTGLARSAASATYTSNQSLTSSSPKFIELDGTSGTVAMTLPSASGNDGLDFYFVAKNVAHTVSLVGTVSGVTNPTFGSQYSVLHVVAINGTWYTVGAM
jgi:streptogramin lyase